MDYEIKENISEVRVWDWQTRALHWLNAVLVISLVILAVGFEWMEELGATKAMRKPVKEIHAYVGYVFVVTLSLRIIWGFIGNDYARWRDTLPLSGKKWKEAFSNLRWILGGLKGTPPVSIGHNPFASILYAALFIVLVTQAATGIFLSGKELGIFQGNMIVAEENNGVPATEAVRPMPTHPWVPRSGVGRGYPVGIPENGKEEDEEHEGAASGAKEGGEKEESVMEEAAEEVHELGLWFMLFFIAAHLIGLVLHEIGERRGLFSSMINGRKYYGKDEL